MPVGDGHSGRGGVQALPPHSPVAGLAHVGEDGVLGDGGHGVRVGFVRGAGRDAEEAVLRVDGSQFSCVDTSWDMGERKFSLPQTRAANVSVLL